MGAFPNLSRNVPFCPRLSSFVLLGAQNGDKSGQKRTNGDKTGHFGTNWETPPFSIYPHLALLNNCKAVRRFQRRKIHLKCPPKIKKSSEQVHLNNFRWVPDSCHREEGKSSRELSEKVRVSAVFWGYSGFGVGYCQEPRKGGFSKGGGGSAESRVTPKDIGHSSTFGIQSTTAKRGVHFCKKPPSKNPLCFLGGLLGLYD